MVPVSLTESLHQTVKTHPKPENAHALRDRLNRPLHDLRISVIDRCNFRCSYCMPENEYTHNHTFLNSQQWLSFDEIVRLTKIFVRLGVAKIRITGGEPLLRPDLSHLIKKITAIKGVEDLALTTNGTLLSEQAAELRAAGLQRITVSLDTLDEQIFRQMNGNRGSVDQILKGIKAAEQNNFKNIKINVVVQKGVNDHTLLDLLEYFKGSGHVVRFIEYMDVGTCNNWKSELVVPSAEILKKIHIRFPLKAISPNYHGEVAARYQYVDGEGEIGFISSVTQPFCGTCTRARISTDGKFYTCLFSGKGTDLREALRNKATSQNLTELIQDIWKERTDRYSEVRALFNALEEKQDKIEMYQIGG